MIKDVMVWLDGGLADEIRLEAAGTLARLFESRIIALYFNALPSIAPVETPAGAAAQAALLEKVRRSGDTAAAELVKRLQMLERPVEIRRFDVLADEIGNIASREARTADTFVALRPNGAMDPERLVESVLFESGRHVFLFPETERPKLAFDRILLAWNGSRESSRAMAEGLPFLRKATEVTVIVTAGERLAEEDVRIGTNAVNHLKHHGVNATLRRIAGHNGDVAGTLMTEAQRVNAGLIVMGGYGHMRLRERLLGGVTYRLMHEAPLPLVMAH